MCLIVMWKAKKLKIFIFFQTDRKARCVYKETDDVRESQCHCAGTGGCTLAAKDVHSNRRAEIESPRVFTT